MSSFFPPKRPARIVNNALTPLAHCVARFCDILSREPDVQDPLGDCCCNHRRSMQVRAHEIRDHLLHLSSSVQKTRTLPLTRIQTNLHDLQVAYRSLQGLMIGVPDHLLDHGESAAQTTIRQFLLRWLSFYQKYAPLLNANVGRGAIGAIHGVSSVPALLTAPGPVSIVPAFHGTRETLSMLFERVEWFQRSLIARLSACHDVLVLPSQLSHIEARLRLLETHLQEQQSALGGLLTVTGHRRTDAMHLAHEIFRALGLAEGAMIGSESRYQMICEVIIDLIIARTTELTRYL